MSETIEASADLAPMRAARPLGTGHHRSRCPHRRGGVVHRCAGAQLRPPLWRITEELDMSPGHRRMDGLRSGSAPVLNTHRSSDARDVVGRVIAARLEGGRGYATLQFSAAADVEPLWQRIADGTLRSVSVGYRVHRYEPFADPRDGTVHRAVDWEPYEISVVPVPAAGVRGAGDQGAPVAAEEPVLPTMSPSQENPMSETILAPPAADPPVASVPQPQQPEALPTDAAAAAEAVPAERARPPRAQHPARYRQSRRAPPPIFHQLFLRRTKKLLIGCFWCERRTFDSFFH